MSGRKSNDGVYLRGRTWWLDFQHEGKRYQERLGSLISKTAAKEIAKVKRSEILKGAAGIKRKRKSLTFDEGSKLFIEWSETEPKAEQCGLSQRDDSATRRDVFRQASR